MTIQRSPRPAGPATVSRETRELAGLPLDKPLDFDQERGALSLRKLELQGQLNAISKRREDHQFRFFGGDQTATGKPPLAREWKRISREYDREREPIIAEIQTIENRQRAIKGKAARDRNIAQEKLFQPNGNINMSRALLDLLRGLKHVKERLDRIEAILEGED